MLAAERACTGGAAPAATPDYSIRFVAAEAPDTTLSHRFAAPLARHGLLVVLLLGAGLLILSEFLTLYEVRAATTVPEGGTSSVGGHHAYALLPIATALAVMATGAVRGGSLPAAVATLVLALAAVVIVLVVDLPDVNETGLIGDAYEQAQARPQAGFYVETLGATLALVGAVLTLALRRR